MSKPSDEIKFAHRILKVEESPTFALERKVDEIDSRLKKEGKYVVRFGMGQPDFNTPSNIKEAGKRAIDENKTKYTPSSGIKELKLAVVAKLEKENGIRCDADNILVGNGAKQVLDDIMRTLVDINDMVLLPKPYWVSYSQQVILSGGIPVEVNFNEDLKMDLEHFRQVIKNSRKNGSVGSIKLLILNSPNNPAGAVYTKKELEEIGEICLSNNIFIVSDEVYEKFIYGRAKHYSIASLSDELKDLTITVNAVSKTYAMTGWRIGYCAARRDIIKQMAKVQDQSPSNPCSISQWAALEALTGSQSSVEVMREEYEKRRDYIYKRLKNIKGVECALPEGAFYIFPKISGLYGSRIKGSAKFAEELLEKAYVAVVPGFAFGDDNYIRISYVASMDKIIDGMDRFEEFCKGI